MRNFDVRYIDQEDRWVFIAPSTLVFPKTAVERIKAYVLTKWQKELNLTSPLTQSSKHEYLSKAIKALEVGKLSQLKTGEGAEVFTSTERTGAIISYG